MKKIFYLIAAAGAAGMMSCSHSAPADGACCDVTPMAPDYPSYYEGTVPGADVAEVSYGVAIVPFADGDTAVYAMRTEYAGEPAKVITENGSVAVSKGTPSDESAVVYTLTPAGASAPAYYFIATDSTLVMVGEDLVPAASGLDYTLKRKM